MGMTLSLQGRGKTNTAGVGLNREQEEGFQKGGRLPPGYEKKENAGKTNKKTEEETPVTKQKKTSRRKKKKKGIIVTQRIARKNQGGVPAE